MRLPVSHKMLPPMEIKIILSYLWASDKCKFPVEIVPYGS